MPVVQRNNRRRSPVRSTVAISRGVDHIQAPPIEDPSVILVAGHLIAFASFAADEQRSRCQIVAESVSVCPEILVPYKPR